MPGSALSFFLAEEEVPLDMQAPLYSHGVASLGKFPALLNSGRDVREFGEDQLDVGAPTGLEQRVQVAALLCAWQAARARVEQQ